MTIESNSPLDDLRKPAFQCPDGRPHQWTYLKDHDKNYRCVLCLIVMPKARLKELTDHA